VQHNGQKKLPLSLDCSFGFFLTFIISSECNVYRENSVYIVEGVNKTYFFLYNHMIMVLVDYQTMFVSFKKNLKISMWWVPSGDSVGLVGSVLLQIPVVIMFLEALALLDL
jgi:hypothetical protein